jgi:hypothetical protein
MFSRDHMSTSLVFTICVIFGRCHALHEEINGIHQFLGPHGHIRPWAPWGPWRQDRRARPGTQAPRYGQQTPAKTHPKFGVLKNSSCGLKQQCVNKEASEAHVPNCWLVLSKIASASQEIWPLVLEKRRRRLGCANERPNKDSCCALCIPCHQPVRTVRNR